MKTIEIHESHIKKIKKWEFFNWYPIVSKKELGNGIWECEVGYLLSGWRNTYFC